jgi:hypothetical protein
MEGSDGAEGAEGSEGMLGMEGNWAERGWEARSRAVRRVAMGRRRFMRVLQIRLLIWVVEALFLRSSGGDGWSTDYTDFWKITSYGENVPNHRRGLGFGIDVTWREGWDLVQFSICVLAGVIWLRRVFECPW